MQAIKPVRLIAFLWAAWSATAAAQSGPSDPVLVENSKAKVYRSEYDAELLKLSPEIRPGFSNNQRRISELLTRLLVQKSLAAEPETAALAKLPENQTRIRLEADRVLAQLRIEDVATRAGKEFDAHKSEYEARARELYTADRKKYETPEEVSASHILFDLRRHPREEGRRLAEQARARIVAGADFNAVAKEVSEDPSAAQNGGQLGYFKRADMDAAFANAAFALSKPGEISEPVLSSFGWHLIKLEGRRPAAQRSFEDVHDLVMAELRKRYVDERREAAINAARDDPSVKLDRDAVDALYIKPTTAPMRVPPATPAGEAK